MDRKAFLNALPYLIPLPSSTVWPPEKARSQSQRRGRQQLALLDGGQYVLSLELQDEPGKVLFFRKDEENDDPALTHIELMLEGDADWMETPIATDGATPSTPSILHNRKSSIRPSPGALETPPSSNTTSPAGAVFDNSAMPVLFYSKIGETQPPFLVDLRHLRSVEWVPQEINNNQVRPESMMLCFDGPLLFRIFSTTTTSVDQDTTACLSLLKQFYNRLVTVVGTIDTSVAHFYTSTATSPATSSSRSASGQDQLAHHDATRAFDSNAHRHDNANENHSLSFLTDSGTKKRKDVTSIQSNQDQQHSKRTKALEQCLATYDSLWNVLQSPSTAQTKATAASTIASLMTASAERQGAVYHDNPKQGTGNEYGDTLRRSLVNQDEWNKALQYFFPLRRGQQQQPKDFSTREETVRCIKEMMQQQKQAIQERCQVYLLPTRE